MLSNPGNIKQDLRLELQSLLNSTNKSYLNKVIDEAAYGSFG